MLGLATRWRGRTAWLWAGGIVTAAALGIGLVLLWSNTGNGDELTLRDVVAAVIAPGKVFHAQCSVGDGGSLEQWYSSDAGATRFESSAGGKRYNITIVTSRTSAAYDLRTGVSSPLPASLNTSGMPLGQPELRLVHIGPLATADQLRIRRPSDGPEQVVEATASRTRKAAEAGEDEPAGDGQTLVWKLNGATLLPRSAHFTETDAAGRTMQQADIVCTTSEMLDAATVDPALFDINALKPAAP